MKSPDHNAKVFKIRSGINLLKEDLRRVSHSSTRRYLENEIAQQEVRLRLIIEKAKTPEPQATQKEVDKGIQNAVK